MSKTTESGTVLLALILDTVDGTGNLIDSGERFYDWPLNERRFKATLDSVRVDRAGPLTIDVALPDEIPSGHGIAVQVTARKSAEKVSIVRNEHGQATALEKERPTAPFELVGPIKTYTVPVERPRSRESA